MHRRRLTTLGTIVFFLKDLIIVFAPLILAFIITNSMGISYFSIISDMTGLKSSGEEIEVLGYLMLLTMAPLLLLGYILLMLISPRSL